MHIPPPGPLAAAAAAATAVIASSLNDDLARMVVIPAGYGVGAAVGGLAGRMSQRDLETRARWRELCGDIGAAAGFGVWLARVFWG